MCIQPRVGVVRMILIFIISFRVRMTHNLRHTREYSDDYARGENKIDLE